jgi:nucleotide-binding universal stress UspA family protein
VAGDLATFFDAGVIGTAMCQPMQFVYSEGYIPTDLIQRDREQREQEIKAAEAEFRDIPQPRIQTLEWRPEVDVEVPAEHLACLARGADLIVTGVDPTSTMFNAARGLNIGDLVMQAGRPVLVVPAAARPESFSRILVGWRDTRETRRAIADALPFLKRAEHVLVAEIVEPGELEAARQRLADVVVWLGRHGGNARPVASPAIREDPGLLHGLALDHKADLIVAGAYGHSRMREWALGGVTRELLLRSEICSLVSH